MYLKEKTNLMHKLFLAYLFNLYIFRAYLGPGWIRTIQMEQQTVI